MSTLLHGTYEISAVVTEKIEDNAERLGIQFVGKNDEKLVPRYPAVIVSPIARSKEVHATHTWQVEQRILLWVYHGALTMTHRQRSDEDILLAEALENLLEEDTTWDNQFIFAFVENSTPGVIQPRTEKSDVIIGTRLTWYATTQKRWLV